MNSSTQTTANQTGLFVNGGSTAAIVESTISNNIEVDGRAFLDFTLSSQVPSTTDPVFTNLSSSTANIIDSTIGEIDLNLGSIMNISSGQFDGGRLFSGSVLEINGASVNSTISMNRFTGLNAVGDGTTGGGTLNGSTIFLCGNENNVSIQGLDNPFNIFAPTLFDFAGSGTISALCENGFPPPSPPTGGSIPNGNN